MSVGDIVMYEHGCEGDTVSFDGKECLILFESWIVAKNAPGKPNEYESGCMGFVQEVQD